MILTVSLKVYNTFLNVISCLQSYFACNFPEQTTHNNKRDDNEVFKQLKTEKNTTQIPQISVKVKFPRLKNLDESTKLFFTN